MFDRDGWTVAHELALYGDIPDAFLTPLVLMCPNKKLKNGGSVAHLLAQQKKLPEWCLTPEILSISDKNGWTVAHILAETGCLPEKFLTDSILWIAGNDGETVLATLAMTSRLPKKLAYSPDGKIAEELLFTAPFYWKTQSTIEILLEKGHFPPEQFTPDLAKRSVKTANSKRDRYQDCDPAEFILPIPYFHGAGNRQRRRTYTRYGRIG